MVTYAKNGSHAGRRRRQKWKRFGNNIGDATATRV
jgi:hypothetical protein